MSQWLWKITRKLLIGLIDCLELVVSDFCFGKRSRSQRYTHRAKGHKSTKIKTRK